MLFRLSAALAALLTVAACDDAMMAAPVAAMPPVSDTAGPGSRPVSPQEAGVLFADVCMAALPDFRATPSLIAARPFTQLSATGTYYHNSLNLSVKLVNDGGEPTCSMVFGTREGPEQAFVAFSTTVDARRLSQGYDAAADVTVEPSFGPDGLTYINARGNADG